MKQSLKRLGSLIAWGLLILTAGAAGLCLYAESRLNGLVLGGLGESFSTKVYAAPYALANGVSPSPERLIARLGRLGYREAAPPQGPGEFSWEAPALMVYLRGFETPMLRQESGLFKLSRREEGWTVQDSTGNAVFRIALEPELAAELSGPKRIRREPATAAEIPEILKKAVVAAEDKRFYSHWGLDLRAIARALWANLRGRPMQGASTITQQLSKNIFLTPKRNLRRKLAEAALAVYLETRYGKEKILALYLNHIYLGQEGAVSVAGVKAASRFYFGKELKDLDLAECAALAGLIRSPYRYNPLRYPEAARMRRDYVLRRMLEEEMIAPGDLAAALAEPLKVKAQAAAPGRRTEKEYFVAEVLRELLPRYGEETIFRHGLSIYTTMDPLLQSAAQQSLRGARHQAALAALDPRSGKVLALAGGKDFGLSQFNRATQALRQPGSAFKPFVYGAALEKGFTPATLLSDATREYAQEGSKPWNPGNFDGIYYGTTTLRQALAHSLNAATLDLAERAGTASVIAFARRMGIQSPLENSLAMALGSSEVSLLELTSAYAPFANGGFRVAPRLVAAVLDAEGGILEYSRFERGQALDPALAYLITSLLESVVREGTAKALAAWGWDRPSAGKTGTTNDGRDAWFVGYTPQLLAGAWAGDDRHRAISATGARDAVPLWAAFMKDASQDYPPADFEKPLGLVSVKIDPLSGLLALSGCPERREELFLEGTQPARDCPLHRGGILGWFRRLFRRQ